MPGEEEEEEEDDLTIQFSVSVTRADGQESLEFACATDGVTVEAGCGYVDHTGHSTPGC
jgi:hypothetical protein